MTILHYLLIIEQISLLYVFRQIYSVEMFISARALDVEMQTVATVDEMESSRIFPLQFIFQFGGFRFLLPRGSRNGH